MIKSQPSTFKHFCGVLPDKLAPFHGVRVNPEKPGWVLTGWTYFKITRAEKQGPHDCHVAYQFDNPTRRPCYTRVQTAKTNYP